jgi:MarR family transcriptional regulator, organic hydroperoxide resistance regulator
MGTRSEADQLDSEILDAMGELIVQFIARGEQIAQRFGVPAFCMKALHVLESSMAMRDLGRRMHCDPSFVTAIADLLEKRGLARREAGTADRRIKNLVLTPEGVGLRRKVEQELMARVPWRSALDEEERACLLSLLRKMIVADSAPTSAADSTPTSTTDSTPTSTTDSTPTSTTDSTPTSTTDSTLTSTTDSTLTSTTDSTLTSTTTPPSTGGEGRGR